ETDDISTRDYFFGITLLSIALVLSCFMGIYQELTYKKYGSNWREGLFYTHCLGLPLFLVFYSDICDQVQILNSSPVMSLTKVLPDAIRKTVLADLVLSLFNVFRIRTAWLYLFFNVLTQYVCISGVHRLNSRVTALTLNLVLNIRKFTSLCISVLYFDNDLTLGMAVGGVLVFVGTFLYSLGSAKEADKGSSELIDREREKTTKLE
ncbi:9752_t:CDS:2, partial [Paraglomus brasilianum]